MLTRIIVAAVASIVAFAALSAAATAAPMPWKRFSEPAMIAASAGIELATCPDGSEMYLAAFDVPDARYFMLFSTETGNVIFLYDTRPEDPSAPPAEIGFGRVDPERNDYIPHLVWVPYQKEAHSDVCSLLGRKPARPGKNTL